MAKRNFVGLFTGKSGKGKGWFLGWHIEQSRKARIIIDPKDEHVGLTDHVLHVTRARYAAMEKAGFHRAWRNVLESYPSVRLLTKGLDLDEIRTMTDGLARYVHERGNMLWVGSEYHRIAPNEKGHTPKWVLILHTDARTCQVDILADTQRPALMDTTVMSQANRRIGFGMDDPNDLKRVAPYFGTYEGRPAIEVLSRLPPKRCLYIDSDSGHQVLVDTGKLTRRVQHNG